MCKSGGALAVKMSTQLSQRELDGKFMFMSCYSVCPTNTHTTFLMLQIDLIVPAAAYI